MNDRLSLRRRAVSALQRSIGRTRISEPPRERTDATRVTRIEVAIASLPPIAREVFILHRFDDLGYNRIAVRLGIGIDEVEAQIVVALTHLRRAVDDDH